MNTNTIYHHGEDFFFNGLTGGNGILIYYCFNNQTLVTVLECNLNVTAFSLLIPNGLFLVFYALR